MRTLGFDIETSKIPIFHPWQKGAFIVSLGLVDEAGWKKVWVFNHDEDSLFSEQTAYDGSKSVTRYANQREMIDSIQDHILFADRLVGHNIKFDLNWLRYLDINFDHCKLWCTKTVEYLLRAQRMGQLKLGDLSKERLSINKIDKVKTFWDAGYQTSEIPLRILNPYLEQDCINALAIYQQQVPEVEAAGLKAVVTIQNANTACLSEIECNGMMFDKEEARKHILALNLSLATVEVELLLLFNFDCNFRSNDELSAGLYGGTLRRIVDEEYTFVYKDPKKSPVTKTRKVMTETEIEGLGFVATEREATKKDGVYKTNKDTIQFLKTKTAEQRKVKKLLVERSGIAKALETLEGKDDTKGLINKVQEDGRIHPQYNQTVTKTGRLSSSDPNGQNIPREGTSPIKMCIVARNGKLLVADLSQIEWRNAAWLSQDPVMLDEIARGVDVHTENAITVFSADPDGDKKKFKELRTIAKIVTFRLLYGGTFLGFYYDNQMPGWSKKEWQKVVQKFWSKYQKLSEWQADNMRQVISSGGLLSIATGRKFLFRKSNFKGGYKPAQVANFPVQGMATADIMPLAMVIIYRKYLDLKAAGMKALIIGQVHDSLLFDGNDEDIKVLAELCTQVFNDLPKYIGEMWGLDFNVPLGGDCEVGDCWGTVEEYKLAA